jgi:hypothetical protein
VDESGDLARAVEKAKELARLPPDRWTPLMWVSGEKDDALPAPFPPESPVETMKRLGKLMNEKVWMISPFEVKIR